MVETGSKGEMGGGRRKGIDRLIESGAEKKMCERGRKGGDRGIELVDEVEVCEGKGGAVEGGGRKKG